MISKEDIKAVVDRELDGTDCYAVEVSVTPDNHIEVEIDSDTRVDMDRCVALTRAIEAAFDRDVEDYELEVGSSGLTTPFKTPRQYARHIGERVEVLAADGKKYRGELVEAGPDSFTVDVPVKVRKEGAKRRVEEIQPMTFRYSEVKYTVYLLEF